jgi:phosphatidate cytidylyltransferase
VYVSLLLGHLVLIRDLDLMGTIPAAGVLLPFVLTWACDTGAYLVGRTWGRRRPWPQVSPRKSLEGAVGGLLSTVVVAWLSRLVFAPFLDGTTAIVLGLATGVVCQAGDLVESMLKRWAGVKDASRLIPGHGGILDRFDSLIMSAPFCYYVFVWMVAR